MTLTSWGYPVSPCKYLRSVSSCCPRKMRCVDPFPVRHSQTLVRQMTLKRAGLLHSNHGLGKYHAPSLEIDLLKLRLLPAASHRLSRNACCGSRPDIGA